MNITKEQAIELANEAGCNYFGKTWMMDDITRLCNLAIKHAAKDVEPVSFLAQGTRFKLSFFEHEDDGRGNTGTYVTCFEGFDKELDGRWVALVAAENDKHLNFTHPTHDDTALLRQALSALERISVESICQASHHSKKNQHSGLTRCPNEVLHTKAITALRERLGEVK